jgi:hypothetical protein
VIYGYEVDGDIWIWSGWWYMDMKWMVIYGYEILGGALNLSSTKLPRPWSPWESSPLRNNPHGKTENWTRDLMIGSHILWPLDLEAGPIYLLTPLSRVLLEKLTSLCSQSRNSPHFMEPESSLPYSQVPVTRPYPEPTPSSLHDPVQLPKEPS